MLNAIVCIEPMLASCSAHRTTTAPLPTPVSTPPSR